VGPVLAAGDHVDRRPHEGCLDDGPVLEPRGEVVAAEVAQPGPQPDIAGGRVLRLEAAHLLDRLWDRELRALEEQLSGEQGTVQGAPRQDRLGHRRRIVAGMRARHTAGMRFRTEILSAGKTAAGIVVPPDVLDGLAAGKKPAVKVTINGYTYRSSVATVDGRSMIGVSNDVRKAAGVAAGEVVDVDVVLDTE